MLSVAKKTTPHFASATLCPDQSHRSRWVGYLLPEDFSMPGLATARLKTEPCAPGLPARKGGPARSKPVHGPIRPPVASAQRSRLLFGRSPRMAGACRAVSPIGALPAKSSSTDPDAHVPPPDLWRAVPTRELMPRDYRQNFAKYSLADKERRGADSPSGASCLRRLLHRFHSSDSKDCQRYRPRSTGPSTHSRRSPRETSSLTALAQVLWLAGWVEARD